MIVGHQDDDRRVTTRKALGVAALTPPEMAALGSDRGAAAHAAVAVPAVPERQRAGVGAPAGFPRRQPGADRAHLGEPTARRRGIADIGREQGDAVLLSEEHRFLGERLPEPLHRQDLDARPVVGADQDLEAGHQEHPAARVGALGDEPLRVQPAVGGPVETGARVTVRRRIGQAAHRLSS
jgi:hypothetical protein